MKTKNLLEINEKEELESIISQEEEEADWSEEGWLFEGKLPHLGQRCRVVVRAIDSLDEEEDEDEMRGKIWS
jgi:hypothetical protein